MRNACFLYFFTDVALNTPYKMVQSSDAQAEVGPRVNPPSVLILQCSSSSSCAPQLSIHRICTVGSPTHHIPDEKPKSNFRMCCRYWSSVWNWLFPCKQDPFLSQAWRDGTRYCDHPLRKKTFLSFSSHSCQQQDSEVASKVKRSLNHRCCRRAGIAHFNQVVKSHYCGCSISFIPWLLMFSWLCGTLSSKDKHQGFYNYQLIISAKVGEVDSQRDNKGVISIQGGYKGYWEDNI